MLLALQLHYLKIFLGYVLKQTHYIYIYIYIYIKGKGKVIPLQVRCGPDGG